MTRKGTDVPRLSEGNPAEEKQTDVVRHSEEFTEADHKEAENKIHIDVALQIIAPWDLPNKEETGTALAKVGKNAKSMLFFIGVYRMKCQADPTKFIEEHGAKFGQRFQENILALLRSVQVVNPKSLVLLLTYDEEALDDEEQLEDAWNRIHDQRLQDLVDSFSKFLFQCFDKQKEIEVAQDYDPTLWTDAVNEVRRCELGEFLLSLMEDGGGKRKADAVFKATSQIMRSFRGKFDNLESQSNFETLMSVLMLLGFVTVVCFFRGRFIVFARSIFEVSSEFEIGLAVEI